VLVVQEVPRAPLQQHLGGIAIALPERISRHALKVARVLIMHARSAIVLGEALIALAVVSH
jgi:hypothetical protein